MKLLLLKYMSKLCQTIFQISRNVQRKSSICFRYIKMHWEKYLISQSVHKKQCQLTQTTKTLGNNFLYSYACKNYNQMSNLDNIFIVFSENYFENKKCIVLFFSNFVQLAWIWPYTHTTDIYIQVLAI